MHDSQIYLADIEQVCIRCGRSFETQLLSIRGREVPAGRVCPICLDLEQADDDQRRGDALLGKAHIPKDYANCSFANFEREVGNGTAVSLAQTYAQDIRQGNKSRGLLLVGPPGCGKTHLAVAVLREVVYGKSWNALFVNVPEWLNQIRAAMQATDGGVPPSPRGAQLVAIDDLGAERSTPWSVDQIYSLINHREANRLPTVVTTNLQMGELEQAIGKPIVSRLTKLCRRVEIAGRDRRRDDDCAESATS